MNIIIETRRLLIRTFTAVDANLIYELNRDPDVTRYTHDSVKDLAHASEILEKIIISQSALYNHGRWAVHVKPTLEILGWCGLKYRPDLMRSTLVIVSKRKLGKRICNRSRLGLNSIRL